MVSPRQRRAVVAWAQTAYQVSERRACRGLAFGRTVVRYQRQRDPAAAVRATRSVPTQPNERLAMDFMHDVLKDARAVRVFTLVDVCTRECVTLPAAAGF